MVLKIRLYEIELALIFLFIGCFDICFIAACALLIDLHSFLKKISYPCAFNLKLKRRTSSMRLFLI